MHLSTLPVEIVYYLIDRLDITSVMRLSQLSFYFKNIVEYVRGSTIRRELLFGSIYLCACCEKPFLSGSGRVKIMLYENGATVLEGPLTNCKRCDPYMRRKSILIANNIAINYIKLLPKGTNASLAHAIKSHYTKCISRPTNCDERYMRSRALIIYLNN